MFAPIYGFYDRLATTKPRLAIFRDLGQPSSTMADAETLLAKIHALPPDRIAEVEDFVESITVQEAARRQAGKQLLELAKRIQNADISEMSMDEITAEVKAVRALRRAQSDAGRS